MKYLNLKSNRGMSLETLINKTIYFYQVRNLCWIRKQNLFVKPMHVNQNCIHGKLSFKNDVDYYGIYKGHFVCFEAKQTLQPKFLLSNLKTHQWNYLQMVDFHSGVSFLVISFLNKNEYFAISFQNLLLIKTLGIKSLDYQKICQYGQKLEIRLPGILDLISFIENEINSHKIN